MTQTMFDLAGFTRATEEHDAGYLIGLYADDAEVRVIDRLHPPSHPAVFTGRAEIAPWLEDTHSRDMTHTVRSPVAAPGRVALTTECLYPDGTQVLCACTAELQDGLISKQSVVQVWDE